MSRALRPGEWFNLAKQHGWWQFLLHDDFYDEDGTATQPEKDVEAPDTMPVPALADAAIDAASLLDYSITRWRLSDDLARSWCQLPPANVLAVLEIRFRETRNVGIRAVVLEIAAVSLKAAGAELVRSAWAAYPENVELTSLVRASASCLPHEEAFGRAVAAIERLAQREQRDKMLSLSYFQSSGTLDWIETHVCEPTTEAWGNLTAASGFTWQRAIKWLAAGRPLSLVAIDALLAIADPRTPLLRTMQPALLDPPTEEELRRALVQYAKRDAVPRVRQRIEKVTSYAAVLSAGG